METTEKNFVNAKTLIPECCLKSAKLSIDDEALPEVGVPKVSETGAAISNKVFIVHGHDREGKE